MATREQTSAAKIDALISQVRGHISSFNDTVQTAAIAIIEHAALYGDCSRAKILARAVPSRMRTMLVGYFRLYSPIGVTIGKTAADDKGRFVSDDGLKAFRERARLAGADGGKLDISKWPKFHIDGAKTHKWFEDPARVAPEPAPPQGANEFWGRIDNFFDKLLKDVARDDERALFAEDERPAILAMAADLQAMVKRYHIKKAQQHLANENVEEEETEEGVTGNVVAGPKPRQMTAKTQAARRRTRGRKAA